MPTEYTPPSNDYLSMSIGTDLVPKRYRGTDKFLDVVCWNICYFHDKDQARVERIAGILGALNADIIVLEEVMEGSLEPVIQLLKQSGAGFYDAAYGTTGGQQRVAFLWDLDWVRAQDNIHELFEPGQFQTPDHKEVFPRLPLWAYFSCRSQNNHAPFDFQLVGLHLKSQLGGGDVQRKIAAQKLSEWLTRDASKLDADVALMGDWNQPPSASCWEPFRALEDQKKALFRGINKENEFSHLMYRNKNEYGSRLDLRVISVAAEDEIADKGGVVCWEPLSKLIASHPKAGLLKQYLADLKKDISDHLPVFVRFYYEEQRAADITRTRHAAMRTKAQAA